jgi:hypothetical protein
MLGSISRVAILVWLQTKLYLLAMSERLISISASDPCEPIGIGTNVLFVNIDTKNGGVEPHMT